jgi:hypothetical protein
MYNLDPNLAKKADVIGAYINETGKYTGTFVRAEKLVSASKGTDGIGFTFKDEAGRECRFDVWTRKGDGTNLSGLNQINAMMACLQIRGMQPVMMNVKKWDNDQGLETMQEAPCFADLMGKSIGVLLRMEEYEKMKDQRKTGEMGWRVGLFAVFQAGTELMASEIMTRKTKPEQLAKVLPMLADKPLKKTAQRTAGGGSDAPPGIQFDDDADIPF